MSAERRNKAPKRGRLRQINFVHVLAAAGIGYLLGGWNTTALRNPELSAADAVTLRFPQQADDGVPASPPPATAAVADTAPGPDTINAAGSNTTDAAELALLDPTPMVPQPVPQPLSSLPATVAQTVSPQPEAAPRPQLTASADDSISALAPVPTTAPAPARPALKPRPAAAPTMREIRTVAARRPAVVNRPGYLFDDAQIASIKARLRLTPSQEQMWPAVEVALRNMAYTHSREPGGYGAPGGATRAAGIDPESVQGLKSAAVPLIMSFNSEQKDEVRNLVHVMGLDQLASEF